MYKIDFEPIGRRGKFSSDNTLLDCARQLNIDLVNLCGGMGSCGRCKVQIVAGQVSRLTETEKSLLSAAELEQVYRLACNTFPLSDVTLNIPPESLSAPQRTQVEGLEVLVDPDPVVQRMDARLLPPTLDSQKTDLQNLLEALKTHGVMDGAIDFRVLHSLSPKIRDNNWHINAAVRGDEVIAVGKPAMRFLGLAVDIGTTKIAGYILDLETGSTLASKGLMNPQISYGEDVISRIVTASKSTADAEKLQSLLVGSINQLTEDLCNEIEAKPEDVLEAVVVGNTAIHHLFLRLPVKQLGLTPYIPAVDAPLDIKAREIGLRFAPGAYVHLLPNIAGYVGADHVAMLLATRIAESAGISLAIDIGTNTEICLNHKGKLVSVSCASGPAFEGAHIKFGMRAAPGAIEYVRVHNNQVEIQTIGDKSPTGICGSGLLDAVAEMRLNGVIDPSGKLSSHPLVQIRENRPEFLVAERLDLEPITITQKDVRELQLAKAAIRVGIQALVEAEGLKESQIQKVIIAGAFGTFINVKSAITIGMLPDLPLERFKQVGNAAGTGARLALISKSERRKSREIAQRVNYIELARFPSFNRKFSIATSLQCG